MNINNTTVEINNRKRLVSLIEKMEYNENNIVGYYPPIKKYIGGLESIGITDDSEYLIVISSTGRGIFSIATGEKIDRDYDNTFYWFDEKKLLCDGFGILLNQKIKMCGLYGGGLPLGNGIGESIKKIEPFWPKELILFESNFNSWYLNPEKCSIIFHDYEIRAYGFSYDGKKIVIATSSDIVIFNKKES